MFFEVFPGVVEAWRVRPLEGPGIQGVRLTKKWRVLLQRWNLMRLLNLVGLVAMCQSCSLTLRSWSRRGMEREQPGFEQGKESGNEKQCVMNLPPISSAMMFDVKKHHVVVEKV